MKQFVLRHLPEILLASLTALLFIYTAPPTIFAGDSGGLTTSAGLMGYAHPPGYPLYSILGFIWTKLFAIGTIGWRMNIFSVIWAVGGVTLVYSIIDEITKDKIAAFIGGLTLAVSSTYWQFAITTEVFSMHIFLSLLITLFILKYYKDPSNSKLLYFAAFIFSLEIAHHHMVILWAPGWMFLLLNARLWKHISLKQFVYLILIVLSGFLWYAYLPLVDLLNRPFYWMDPLSFQGLVDIFLRKAYGTFNIVRGGSSLDILGRWDYFPVYGFLAMYSFGIIGTVLSILGIFQNWLLSKLITISLLLNFLLSGIVFLIFAGLEFQGFYRLGAVEKFSVTSLTIVGIFIGLGAHFVILRIHSIGEHLKLRNFVQRLLVGLLFLVPFLLVTTHWDTLNLRNYWDGWYLGRDTVYNIKKNGILTLTGDSVAFNTWYVLLQDKIRPDVLVSVAPYQATIERFNQHLIEEGKTVPVDPSDREFVLHLLKNYPDDYSLYSYSPPPYDPNRKIVPIGMSFRVFDKSDEPQKDDYIREIRSFLGTSLYLNRPTGIDRTVPALAKSIQLEYAQSLAYIGFHLNTLEEIEFANEVFARGYELYSHIPDNAVGMSMIYVKEKNCEAAIAVLDEYMSQGKSPDLMIQTQRYTVYDTCYEDPENAKKVKKSIIEQFGEESFTL